MDFYEMVDLAKTRSLLIPYHKPGSMCTMSPHMLLYTDVLANEIRWCTTAPPVPLTCTKVTKVKLSVEDMCIAENKGKTLIVLVDSFEGIFAFNAETNKKEWSFHANELTTRKGPDDEEEDDEDEEMSARSITSDNRGYLSVILTTIAFTRLHLMGNTKELLSKQRS